MLFVNLSGIIDLDEQNVRQTKRTERSDPRKNQKILYLERVIEGSDYTLLRRRKYRLFPGSPQGTQEQWLKEEAKRELAEAWGFINNEKA